MARPHSCSLAHVMQLLIIAPVYTSQTIRVGQNRIYTPCTTVYLVISLPKTPYINRIYVVLANPTNHHTAVATALSLDIHIATAKGWPEPYIYIYKYTPCMIIYSAAFLPRARYIHRVSIYIFWPTLQLLNSTYPHIHTSQTTHTATQTTTDLRQVFLHPSLTTTNPSAPTTSTPNI
jgi:hypothetical protein